MRRMAMIALTFGLGACGGGEEGSAAAGGGPMQHSMAGAVDTTGLRLLAVPTELEAGRMAYDRTCAACHGEAGLGTSTGPPLIHIVYEPNHHADAAFILAAERGVRAHHWGFGDMPPQPGVQREELVAIVAYIRWLQREAGVY